MPKTADQLKGEEAIDSRDIIEAQANLRNDIVLGLIDPDELDDDERALLDFEGESEVGGDWEYGETLILDSYFEDYARDLAESIGAISGDEDWPLNCIDWERAARELLFDYHSVEFLGFTYYVRSS